MWLAPRPTAVRQTATLGGASLGRPGRRSLALRSTCRTPPPSEAPPPRHGTAVLLRPRSPAAGRSARRSPAQTTDRGARSSSDKHLTAPSSLRRVSTPRLDDRLRKSSSDRRVQESARRRRRGCGHARTGLSTDGVQDGRLESTARSDRAASRSVTRASPPQAGPTLCRDLSRQVRARPLQQDHRLAVDDPARLHQADRLVEVELHDLDRLALVEQPAARPGAGRVVVLGDVERHPLRHRARGS